MQFRSLCALLLCGPLLGACEHPGQNLYAQNEVGRSKLVNFGTVIAIREVNIVGKDARGAALGSAVGGIGGSQLGSGSGSVAGALVGVAIGAVAGAAAENAVDQNTATEYTVTLQTGATLTVVQAHNRGDRPITVGDRVIVQMSAGTQRVLPAAQLPDHIAKPKGITLISADDT